MTLYLVGAAIVLPAFLALAAYAYTRNPSLRPLAITRDSLAAAGQLETTSPVLVAISVGTQAELPVTSEELRNKITGAFRTYLIEPDVMFRRVEGSAAITATYIVGNNQIGPYAYEDIARGIAPATDAVRVQAAAAASKAAALARNPPKSFWGRLFSDRY
ncbi:hypothetical protein AQS8620_00034 [Aquimixticola soesokkakensis]|uniref:Uncharacterized protein n=1 Tax=Aquimixticola soesokkakensis TaxID=1519096 RepID=A0A1Y5RAF6_9RHOB|nr:hypothetical protein [Aquimixticola soesokkakensis]SLN10339.1 hypothetical protein AQS8620_00034 [Aquimixticola soesokkakensis]